MMLNELRDKVNELCENGDRKHKKKPQSEMKNKLTKMKNTLHEINSGVDEAEDQIRDLETKKVENTQSGQQNGKRNRLRDTETILKLARWEG